MKSLVVLFGLTVSEGDPTFPPFSSRPPISTEAPLAEFNGYRCPNNDWNGNILKPAPSSGALCPQYSCNSCCNEEKLIEHLDGNKDKTVQYGAYHFDGCDSKGKRVDGSGKMSSKCHNFIMEAHCLKSCDPNSYVYYHDETTGGSVYGAHAVPTCDSFCSDFYNACKNDYICYKPDGMKEVLDALLDEGGLDEEKDYDAFECKGEYTCRQLSQTIFAGSGSLYEGSGIIKDLLEVLQGQQPDLEAHQHFCSRFSFNLYNPVLSTDSFCIDPRSAQDMVSAVKRHQVQWNTDHPKDKREYPITEPCSTGLSGGAIAGIVIGSLAGAALIGVGIYFLVANSGKEESDSYQPGAKTKSQIKVEMHDAAPGQIVKNTSNHDYEPNQ